MTVIEALNKAEEILGTIPFNGKDAVKKANALFDIIDATVSALQQAGTRGEDDAKGENNGTV